MPDDPRDLTALLAGWRDGDRAAGDELMAAAYDQLRRLAAHSLRHERADQRVDATELVNDLYVKLCAGAAVAWQDRAHFFALARQADPPHPRGPCARTAGEQAGR